MRGAARTALAVPLMIGGAAVVLAFGTGTVFAASSGTNATVKTPVTSSKPHEHENVVCSPAIIVIGGTCTVTFTDIKNSDEKHPSGQKVCFSVSPTTAGTVKPKCSLVMLVGTMYQASATFYSNPNSVCGNSVIIYATEPKEDNQRHHTTETITCYIGAPATNTSFTVPASPSPPAGEWLLGAMGVGAALVTGYALRRRFAARRLAASQSA